MVWGTNYLNISLHCWCHMMCKCESLLCHVKKMWSRARWWTASLKPTNCNSTGGKHWSCILEPLVSSTCCRITPYRLIMWCVGSVAVLETANDKYRRQVLILWPRSYEPRALPLRHPGVGLCVGCCVLTSLSYDGPLLQSSRIERYRQQVSILWPSAYKAITISLSDLHKLLNIPNLVLDLLAYKV